MRFFCFTYQQRGIGMRFHHHHWALIAWLFGSCLMAWMLAKWMPSIVYIPALWTSIGPQKMVWINLNGIGIWFVPLLYGCLWLGLPLFAGWLQLRGRIKA